MELSKIDEAIKYFESVRKRPYVESVSINFMIDFITKNNLKTVLEIGACEGYSAIMFSSVVDKVKTIEISDESAEIVKNNLNRFDIKNVEILHGDANIILKNLNGKFDVIFIDAMKKYYKNYLELSLRLLNDNGVIFADNTISHKEDMQDFFDYLKNSDLNYKELNIGRGLMRISK